MSQIYITSDWHFNHNKPFLYEPRGCFSIEEMNQMLIDKHNALVRPGDDVYVLGDLCLGGGESLAANKELIERMNGNLHIIRGNHDTAQRIDMYETCKNVVEVLSFAEMLIYRKYHFYLSHYPTITSNQDFDKPLKAKVLNICGHSHTNDRWKDWDKGYIYHVEPEAHNGFPCLLDDIIEEFKEKINIKGQ